MTATPLTTTGLATPALATAHSATHPMRRHFLRRLGLGAGGLAGSAWLAGCGGGDDAAEDLATTAPAEAQPGVTAQAAATTGWRMPDEAEPHAATWMAFCATNEVWGRRLAGPARQALARMANAIINFEPVRMLVRPADLAAAQAMCDARVQWVPCALDDLWLRDTGAVFVKSAAGARAAVGFNFNGWGGKQRCPNDSKVAAAMVAKAGVAGLATRLVLEGGSLDVDGRGTAILTESAVLNRNRNPGLTKAACEAELKRLLGLRKIIWLPGIAGRDITDGHVDFYARFVRPGVVVAARDNDPASYDYAVTRRHLDILRRSTDADGRALQVVELPAPSTVRATYRNSDFAAGYVNFYVANRAVFVPEFGDRDADGLAQQRLAAAYPDRQVVPLNIDAIAAGGGGIHCCTQQQPA